MRLLPLLSTCAIVSSLHAADFNLPATPATVVWGYYSADAKPVLTVHSGDVVRIQTASSCPSITYTLGSGGCGGQGSLGVNHPVLIVGGLQPSFRIRSLRERSQPPAKGEAARGD